MINGGGVWGAAPGSPQEWGLGQRPNSSPQELGFKGLAPCTWGTIIPRMSLHGAEPQWGLGQRPRGVRGAAPMPSAGARDRRTRGCKKIVTLFACNDCVAFSLPSLCEECPGESCIWGRIPMGQVLSLFIVVLFRAAIYIAVALFLMTISCLVRRCRARRDARPNQRPDDPESPATNPTPGSPKAAEDKGWNAAGSVSLQVPPPIHSPLPGGNHQAGSSPPGPPPDHQV
ncbi:uncharacterized protein EI90DRAFT_3289998 [Cantharellus anzutake]|uniref:uncharacterized protein n=1 Tax=Cantharellus anzutake TaxID=1750568 RepID=UPI001904A7D4|nr:uncharacterized protein EI90DRAFT_3289998 [Cantharellus anzutake]KAF8329720.1 hypothetical protein EI90DRAFT_3289998 [Cantharellus anzutake]